MSDDAAPIGFLRGWQRWYWRWSYKKDKRCPGRRSGTRTRNGVASRRVLVSGASSEVLASTSFASVAIKV